MVLQPDKGHITVLDVDVVHSLATEKAWLRQHWGVLFQKGALFSSLTVAENIAIGLKEYTDMPISLINDLVSMKIYMAGLPAYIAKLYPAELSGGMDG